MDRKPPANAGAAGTRLWIELTSKFDMDPHELELLDPLSVNLL